MDLNSNPMMNQQNTKKPGAKHGARKPRRRKRFQKREQREFEQKILELSRVTRVTKGGKRMRFRTCLLIGDRKGRVGVGVAKGADVQISIEKAYRQAKKNVITVPMSKETIPYEVKAKFGAAKVIIKPAPKGTGLKSGGAVRMVLSLAGVPNAVSKILGTNNKINNAKAAFAALGQLKAVEEEKKEQKKAESRKQKTDQKTQKPEVKGPAKKKPEAKKVSKKVTVADNSIPEAVIPSDRALARGAEGPKKADK